jgi:recombinase
MKYGYLRVSTNTQDETRQREALKKYGVLEENIYLDKASGKNFIDRTEWQKLLVKVIIGDIIVIKELDRLGRNNAEIKETFILLKNKGVYLEFLDQPLLNTTNKSQIEIELVQPIILHLLGYFAEKEREKIKIRQKEAYDSLEKDSKGRKISRKKKKVVGRPNKIEKILQDNSEIIKLWIEKKITTKKTLEILNISRSSLFRIKNDIKGIKNGETNFRYK